MIITRQTQKERELLNIAKEIINSFENEVAAIGGSLMLSCMGIRKLRESNDIDIVLKIFFMCLFQVRKSKDLSQVD